MDGSVPHRVREDRAKRAFDLVAGSAALVLASPAMAVIAVILLMTQGRPILFRQVRPGWHGRPFRIAKFRTMRAPRVGEVAHATDAVRVTRIGQFLRASSLDELPELWNVVRGEMSLVGPRPLLTEYLDAYTPEQARRHDVRPGVTGWAAVNGRHALRFEDRVALDVWYVDHRSLRLDLRIIAMTVGQVLGRTDVTATQDPTEIGFPLPDIATPDAPSEPRSNASTAPRGRARPG